jgi:hypothetical protein
VTHQIRGQEDRQAAARPPHLANVIERLRRTEAQFVAAGSGEEAPHVGGPSVTPPPRAGFYAKIARPADSDPDLPVGDGSIGLYSFVELCTSNSTGGGSAPSAESVEALELAGGRSGVLNAYELTGKTDVPEGSVVWLVHSEAAPVAAAAGLTPGGNAESYAFKYVALPGSVADQKFARVTVPVGPAAGDADCLHSVGDCAECPVGAPPSWSMTLAGGTGDFAGANGSWILYHDADCVWSGTLGDWAATLELLSGGAFTLDLTGPGGAWASWAEAATVSCGGPLAAALTGGSGAGVPTAPTLRASCTGTACTQGEGVLITAADGACGWDDGETVVLEPLDGFQSLMRGHVYEVFLKTPATDDSPAVYLADSSAINYFQDITVVYDQTTITYVESTVNYFDVDLFWSEVNITLLTDITIVGNYTWIFDTYVQINVGLAWCGWWWVCPESFVVSGAVIDPSTGDPHALERLTPSVDGVVLPGITPVAGPAGTQALYLTNVAAADSLVLQGAAWFLPGASQLPLKLHAGDGCLAWYDGADAVWRLIGTSYGDFRFAASSALTVTIWNADREADFVPEGDIGEVLTQTADGPQWEPLPPYPGDWSITHYKTDCVGGVNIRSVRTASMTSGVFAAGTWEEESVQGCCECDEPTSGPCCYIDDHPDLCITFSGALADVGTVTLTWGGSAWSGSGPALACAAVGAKAISLSCENGLWDLDVSSCDPAAVTVLSCDPLLLNAEGPDCVAPCGGSWTAVITEAPAGGCPADPVDPPPGCCEDVPVSVTAGDTFPVSLTDDCTYVFMSSVGSVESIVVSTQASGGFYHVTIALSSGAMCAYSRAEADGCLGVYNVAYEAGCSVAFPTTVTVN